MAFIDFQGNNETFIRFQGCNYIIIIKSECPVSTSKFS